ncbi:MAG: hypothetical protein HQL82_01170 [Magnetococcales bacterium]|nr:hypothetical protein [Magnetococcales bacterium]
MDDTPDPATPAPPQTHWFLAKWAVWAMIILFGPLAIPQLLLSPRFTRRSKLILTMLLLLGSLLMVLVYPWWTRTMAQWGLG